MAEKKNRRTQVERREEAEFRLISAAKKLTAAKGYDGYSLAEVGHLAGYSRGLAGHYFTSKEELQKRVAEHVLGEYYLKMAQLPITEPGIPTVQALVRLYVQTAFEDDTARTLTVLLSAAGIDEGLRETMNHFHLKALGTLEYELARGVKHGTIRSDINVEHQAAVVYSFLRGQLNFISLMPDRDYAAFAEQFLENLEAAIGK